MAVVFEAIRSRVVSPLNASSCCRAGPNDTAATRAPGQQFCTAQMTLEGCARRLGQVHRAPSILSGRNRPPDLLSDQHGRADRRHVPRARSCLSNNVPACRHTLRPRANQGRRLTGRWSSVLAVRRLPVQAESDPRHSGPAREGLRSQPECGAAVWPAVGRLSYGWHWTVNRSLYASL